MSAKAGVNVKAKLSQVQWNLVLKTAVLLYILTFILGLGVSLLLPVFLNWDHTDSQMALQAFSVFTVLLVIVVTGYGAWRVAHKVERAAALHGFLVGLVVALLSFLLDLAFIREIHLMGLLLYALMVASGWLGGVLGSRRREQS